MRYKQFLILSMVACLTSIAVLAGVPQAQEKILPLDKILNPLPDYKPFRTGAPAETPKYFPDEIDKRSRELLIDALINREDALSEHLQFFQSEDARLQKERGTSTGLTAQAHRSRQQPIRDREKYMAAQKEALKRAASPERKKYLEAVINNDDFNQSNALMRQSSTNFWGGMANRLLGSVDLVGVASGNYVGAVAEDYGQPSLRAHGPRHGCRRTAGAGAGSRSSQALPGRSAQCHHQKTSRITDKKKKNALTRKQIDKAKEAFAKNDFERAAFHLDMVALSTPSVATPMSFASKS